MRMKDLKCIVLLKRMCRKMEASGIEIGKDAMELDKFREELKEELKNGIRELKDARGKFRKVNLRLFNTRKKIRKYSRKLQRAKGKLNEHSMKLSENGDKCAQSLEDGGTRTAQGSNYQDICEQNKHKKIVNNCVYQTPVYKYNTDPPELVLRKVPGGQLRADPT